MYVCSMELTTAIDNGWRMLPFADATVLFLNLANYPTYSDVCQRMLTKC